MHIVNGTTVNPAWTDTILIGDGVAWQTHIQGASVQKVGGTYIGSANSGKYPSITKLRLGMVDGTAIDIELQEVSNQATWNTGTQFALDTAIADIQGWLL